MAFRFFAVPIREPEPAQEELNSFLQSHKVLTVDRRWVDQGADSFWSVCVDYHASGTKSAPATRGKKSQVDYKEVLSEEDFAVYSALRELRKQVAQQENVAVYLVFTNEQLAEMVRQRATTKTDLEKIAEPAALESGNTAIGSSKFSRSSGAASMRRAGNLSEPILDRDNFRLAFSKAIAGKRHRDDARRFAARLEENTARLIRQVADGSFAVGRYHQFVIHDPKQRVITAPCFEERVVHHAIMNVCEPVFDRWLIHDTYACRVGRGREAAIMRANRFARSHPFYLKLDVRKYFDSICHTNLLARLERLFKDPWLLDLFRRIVTGFRGSSGRGLPIGSLTSQHFANFYLGWFDRFVKETLRVKGYVRYMDDVAIWAHSRRRLRHIRDHAREHLSSELSLELKPIILNRTSHGMDFLGCRLYDNHTILNRRSRVRFRREFVQLERDFLDGWIDERQLQQRASSMFAFARAAGVSSWRFRQRVLEQAPVSGRMARTG